jgi:hypothetical protein
MTDFFSRLVGILMLRDGPQDLPPGTPVLAGSVAIYVAATSVSIARGDGAEHPAAVMALAVVLPMVLSRIVLGLRNRLARWPQTLSALFGTSGLLSLLALPLSATAGSEPLPVLIVASLVLFFWSFAVDAHIWRHALDTSFAAGMAVAVLLFAVSMVVITSLAGPL